MMKQYSPNMIKGISPFFCYSLFPGGFSLRRLDIAHFPAQTFPLSWSIMTRVSFPYAIPIPPHIL